ncbi:heme ABC transporter ATP-binding protein [Subtercola boreus]|uniref:Heme ABC transporter ATP-binding protein n=1 Tax=Subtercola boreus TaxID=120213 RepID=A0A3E0VBY2_9MICO|nr:sugar ABC transporter ATP-binding protein [Subtercola boreus]RFA07155.1 heme ABC transporter ATP-binding protein [Subtercola boreus]
MTDSLPHTTADLVVDVRDVSKQYPNVKALTRVDFTVSPGEVRALLGKNGAGKSTMIRLLSGAETPDSGQVFVGGHLLGTGGIDGARALGVRTVYQELSLIQSMTIAENMFMGHWLRNRTGIDYRAMAAATDLALKRLALDFRPNQLVSELGIADQQMVEIARALMDDLKLLILDEPTSSLSAGEVTRVLDVVAQLSSEGVAVIYVSHRLSEIRRVASSASVMRDGRLIDTRAIGELTTREVVQMMLGEAASEMEPIESAPDGAGEILISVRGLTLEPKLRNVDLDLRAGEVIGIAGILGSGRTELLQSIAGIVAPDSGSITMAGRELAGRGNARALRSGIGMTPENRKEDGIFPLLGIDENIVVSDWRRVSSGGVLRPRRVAAAAQTIVDQMSIKTSSTRAELNTLSGGNQQKAVIGRWLHADSTVLLLDEPTRGVDIEAKAQIYALIRNLAASGRVVVFVSSEVEELPAVCDRVFVLRGGELVDEFVAPNISTDTLLATAMAEH